MSAINFNELYGELKSGVETVAKQSLHDYVQQAKSDGLNALGLMKTNLQHWTGEVENGSMTTADLSFLLKGDEGLTEMAALKEAGLSAVHIDMFRNNLINMFVSTLTGFIKV